jgi:prevent-host-death family protein
MPLEVVNIHQAKTHLSRLVERVEAGEEVIIGRAGKPIARLVPYVAERQPRVFGALQGQIRILPGFGEMDAEIGLDFETSLELAD